MKFGHKCVEARWNDETSKWHVKIENVQTGEVTEDIGDVFVTGIGVLNDWKWPDIKGLDELTGPVIHSANWDESFDAKVRVPNSPLTSVTDLDQDKTVAVIGAGSSGIQIVPTLQPHVKSMDHYVRGRTWIAATFGNDLIRERNNGQDGNFEYTQEERDEWKKKPDSYVKYRKALEAGMQGTFAITHRGTPEHDGARAAFDADMRYRLAKKPEIISHLLPDFPPLCKRLTPGPGYLEALTAPNVAVIPTPIDHISATGIITTDGTHRAVDAIICATGFDTSFRGRFPIHGRHGLPLHSVHPATYLSVCTASFPNFFHSLGPNSGLGNGNLIVVIEAIRSYIAQILRKLAYENVRTIEPKPRAVQNFTNYCDAFFKRTVFSATCNSWYKAGGRVTALWPGSSVHAVRALERVRWEDFEMTLCGENEMGWLGDGWTVADRRGDQQGLSWYLDGMRFTHLSLEEEQKGKVG